MTQADLVYEYLREHYPDNTPIFMSEIKLRVGIKESTIRQALKRLVEENRIKRFDQGIYYFPKKTIFRSGSVLSIDEVIRKKYLVDEGGHCCGYVGGLLFANQIGLTPQVPMVYEVFSNRATTDCRRVRLAGFRIILRKPRVRIDDDNCQILQFLDLLSEVMTFAELDGEDITACLARYMRCKKKVLSPSSATYHTIQMGYIKVCMRWEFYMAYLYEAREDRKVLGLRTFEE